MLVVMDQFTRRLIGFGMHRGAVDAPGLCCMFNAAIHGQGTPRYLSTDHDPLFEAHRWTANLRLLEVDEIKTVPHVPLSHPFVERLIGTIRRELLDHVLFLEWARSGTKAGGVSDILQRGAEPCVARRPDAVSRCSRTSGGQR